MPTKGTVLGPGTLIFVDIANGQDFSAMNGDVIIPVLPPGYADEEEIVKKLNSCEATFTLDTIDINRLTWLSLIHGRKVTNNWLKMHGGVMIREAWKKN